MTSDVPRRIQRKRTRGWRLPGNAVVVTRPGRWGNPWREGSTSWTVGPGGFINRDGRVLTRVDAIRSFAYAILNSELMQRAQDELAGKNLACWCRPDQPCHADFLLAIANGLEMPGWLHLGDRADDQR